MLNWIVSMGLLTDGCSWKLLSLIFSLAKSGGGGGGGEAIDWYNSIEGRTWPNLVGLAESQQLKSYQLRHYYQHQLEQTGRERLRILGRPPGARLSLGLLILVADLDYLAISFKLDLFFFSGSFSKTCRLSRHHHVQLMEGSLEIACELVEHPLCSYWFLRVTRARLGHIPMNIWRRQDQNCIIEWWPPVSLVLYCNNGIACLRLPSIETNWVAQRQHTARRSFFNEICLPLMRIVRARSLTFNGASMRGHLRNKKHLSSQQQVSSLHNHSRLSPFGTALIWVLI